MINTYASLHCHSEYSSAVLRFPDAIGHISDSVNWCYDNGLYGYAISDHQTVSGYVDLEQAYNNLPKDKPFKHIFANEFYLISEEEDNLRFIEDQRPYYHHFMVYVLDEIGLKQMYELSARAWLRSYTYKGLLRRPSFYSDFIEVIGESKGHLACSSACVSGYLPQQILDGNKKKAIDFINMIQDIFGEDNFYLECQPCYEDNKEQISVNEALWSIHEKLGLPIIVTTDAHYMRPEDKVIHKAYLNSKDGGDSRETDKFYATTYLLTPQELRDMLKQTFTDAQIDVMFQTTIDLADRCNTPSLKKITRVPALPEIPDHEVKHYYKKYYNNLPSLNYFANSTNSHDTYYYAQVENGLHDYLSTHEVNEEEYLKEVDWEMEQVKGLGEIFKGECMADYFTVVQKIVDLIWSKGDSLVGIGRGSAGAYLTNKLLGITGIDPMLPETKEFYPPWRFCSVARSDSLFDIDIDIQSFKKEQIIKAIKDYFGWRRVCQVVTWNKLTSKTALERAGKGLGYSDDTIAYIKSLIPVKRGATYSINDCLYGNPKKDREKVPAFASEVSKYPNLLETALALEGMIVSSGVHAGALNILKADFTETGSYMVSSNGAITSQFDLHQAEYCGDLKMDLLSIDALECIRACMDLLIADGRMEWQGTLRNTYNNYLGYDVLEKESKEMWALLPTMLNAFQYDTKAGKNALNKIGANSLTELTLANGLMRLAVPNGEQPIDKYVRYKTDINEWYKDMTEYGLSEEEQSIFKDLLGNYCGMCISQETMMVCLMDKRVCNFSLKFADKARKAVAKKSAEALAETEERLYRLGAECGRSKTFLDYLWKVQIEMSKSYAFAFSHSHEYSTECLQELNMFYHYPSVYWNAAVIITQSQTEDDRENSAVAINYGKIANSIYKAKQNGIQVQAPSINESALSFCISSNCENILYGLAGISGINSEIAQQIISNRPYDSFADFYKKNSYAGSLVTNSKFVQLVKAGCFDDFSKNRVRIMKEYIMINTPKPTSLTMQNMSAIKSVMALPKTIFAPYNFFKYVCSKPFLYGAHPKFKSKKIYWLDDKAMTYFANNCRSSLKENVDYWEENDKTVVVDKSLEKLLSPSFDAVKEYINTKEFIESYYKATLKKKFNEMFPNQDQNHWSFESCSYYSQEHELSKVNLQDYNVECFSELPTTPIFIERSFRGRTWNQYELYAIAGTLIDRDDTHNFITILTVDDEVVTCKMPREVYAFYKQQLSVFDENGKKTVTDPSWLARGNLLILSGYRSDDVFICKKYTNSVFQHQVQKINRINDDGSLDIMTERNES